MKGLVITIAAAALLLTTAMTGFGLDVNTGGQIYAVNCASCHGLTDSTITPSSVKSANAGQITKAFKANLDMQNSILRTNTSVALGAAAKLKGKLSGAQLNAIVAWLSLYHGEDLYTAKFTDPSKQSWNCSYCHFSYDQTNVAGASLKDIVNGFKQTKLGTNSMAPLKSKYKTSELQLIVKALAVAPSNNSGGGSTTIDGAKLYYVDCMPCHNGPILGVRNQSGPPWDLPISWTVDSITSAIANVPAMKNNSLVASLTDAQKAAIVYAIQTDQKPADLGIYQWPSCAASADNNFKCHNTDGTTGPNHDPLP